MLVSAACLSLLLGCSFIWKAFNVSYEAHTLFQNQVSLILREKLYNPTIPHFFPPTKVIKVYSGIAYVYSARML